MWGTRSNKGLTLDKIRFIPTYVGNAVSPVIRWQAVPVHPHVCGERATSEFEGEEQCGSSPRMWGTHIVNNLPYSIRRFIPTYVGNAAESRLADMLFPVHPHVCGERIFI